MPVEELVPYQARSRAVGRVLGSLAGNMARTWLRSGRNRVPARQSTAIRQRNARSRTFTRTRTRINRGSSGTGVTEQYDRKLIYRKRSMPRFKRKRWKRFKNKVNAVAEKELGAQTVVFNRQASYSNQNPTFHVVSSFYLYGGKSTETFANDLAYISSLGNAGAPTVADGVTSYKATKYLFHSGVLDITIQNRSYVNTGTLISPVKTYGNECKMELDIYELAIPWFATTNAVNFATIEALLDDAKTQQETIKDNNAGPSVDETSIFRRGCTPWDLSYSLSRYQIKILKKTKFMLNVNETVTYQSRDPKRHSMMKQHLNTIAGFTVPRMTRIILVMGKLVPGASPLGPNTNEYTESYTVGATRKYLFKYEGENDDRSLYVPQ
ncbi:MAG: capsid protein [Cressdnaviricota sp.]|nr:MAG: capsid protein [Cressdnaviricota sp.]